MTARQQKTAQWSERPAKSRTSFTESRLLYVAADNHPVQDVATTVHWCLDKLGQAKVTQHGFQSHHLAVGAVIEVKVKVSEE